MINYSRLKPTFSSKKRLFKPFFAALVVSALGSSPVFAVEEDLAPESATGISKNASVISEGALVVTAHPLATAAGQQILRNGGTAADAAVAIQAMLTLVEPQSSGIGGGAFMLYWDQQHKQLHAYDGRETAPALAGEKLFYRDGKPMKWHDAMVGGRSVGTPGVLKMLELSHSRHGNQSWKSLFSSAIQQSKEGFTVGPRLHQLIASNINPGLKRYPEALNYFFTGEGEPLPIGFNRTNPELAQSLTLIAEKGASAFYQGPLARKITEKVQQISDNPGLLSMNDMAAYAAKERSPICLPYLSYKVCGFPPPTSGGVTVLQILKLLENQPLADMPPNSLEFNHLFTQASRLAFADRGRYLADADFVDVPVNELLSQPYLDQRAQLISAEQDMGKAAAGKPEKINLSRADDKSPERPSTSHFVVRDQWGNAVSMTTSIEMAFGSTVMAGGFLLNNQLTDFSFVAEKDGQLVANRVQPGKRPRSSMSPFMVFDKNGELYAAIGSPGGSRIINYVAQSLLVMLNTDMPLQEVVSLPHVSNRNSLTELEQGTPAEQLQEQMEKLGHKIKVRDLNSGLHGFRRLSDGRWESGVDNRREGEALSQ